MNIHPTFTNLRSHISYKFWALRTRALRDRLWSKLTRRNSSLRTFPEKIQYDKSTKKLLGIKEIRVDQIIGLILTSACNMMNGHPLSYIRSETDIMLKMDIIGFLSPAHWESYSSRQEYGNIQASANHSQHVPPRLAKEAN